MKNFMDRITDAADLKEEPIPGLPLIEIAGDRRVLIEHHCGVTEYGCHRISVRVRRGLICVTGQGLELTRMSKELLIITGRIEAVQLSRRES